MRTNYAADLYPIIPIKELLYGVLLLGLITGVTRSLDYSSGFSVLPRALEREIARQKLRHAQHC